MLYSFPSKKTVSFKGLFICGFKANKRPVVKIKSEWINPISVAVLKSIRESFAFSPIKNGSDFILSAS